MRQTLIKEGMDQQPGGGHLPGDEGEHIKWRASHGRGVYFSSIGGDEWTMIEEAGEKF